MVEVLPMYLIFFITPAPPLRRHSERSEESTQPTSLTVKEILRGIYPARGGAQDDGVGVVLGRAYIQHSSATR
jgi:hypothetical protein